MELGGCGRKRDWLSFMYLFILAGLCLSGYIGVWGRELDRNDGWRTREGKAIGLKLRLRHRDLTATSSPPSSSASSSSSSSSYTTLSSSSPAAASYKSLRERLGAAVKRSWRRLEYFERAAVMAAAGGGGAGYEAHVQAGEGAFIAAGAAIGTPAVGFTAVVDTGSDLVWRQCRPCAFCYAQPAGDPIFDPASSSTFHVAPCSDPLCQALPSTSCPSPNCSYTYAYGDYSFTSGDLAYDTLTLPASSSQQPIPVSGIAFGCGHDNEFSNFAGAGGLLGLGQGPLSLPSQLGLNEFSYCLQTITDPTSRTSPLFLGPIGDLGASFILSTPIITNPLLTTLYYIRLKGISVGGQLLDLPSGTFDLHSDGTGGLIIDSSTTLTYLVMSAYLPLLQAFNNSINLPSVDGSQVGLDLCYEKSGKVPSLTFHFDGGDLALPTENYFIAIQGMFCLAMAPSTGISIFGNIQQQNFLIHYNQGVKTLSFAPKTCDSL